MCPAIMIFPHGVVAVRLLHEETLNVDTPWRRFTLLIAAKAEWNQVNKVFILIFAGWRNI